MPLMSALCSILQLLIVATIQIINLSGIATSMRHARSLVQVKRRKKKENSEQEEKGNQQKKKIKNDNNKKEEDKQKQSKKLNINVLQHLCCYSGKQQRQSVPLSLNKFDIKPFLKDLMKNSEPWRAMKLVVLGNGRIGKTTMLHSLKKLVNGNTVRAMKEIQTQNSTHVV